MRISRVFVASSVFIIGILASTSFVLSSMNAEAADQSKSIQFSKLAENEVNRLDVDLESVHSITDTDGDLLVGAITRVIAKDDSRQSVYAVTAVCGYNGLIVLRSKTFDGDGKMIRESIEPEALADLKPATMAGITYTFLCKNAPKSVPTPPSYKAPDRYKNLWT